MTLPVPRSSRQMQRWDPFRELDEFHDRMNQLMASVFGPVSDVGAGSWTPLADVRETDDAYLVEVELPGIRQEDLELETTGSELQISGELKDRERTGWLRSRTRRVGRFEYRTSLPQGADPEKISAELADGVLTVRVPKSETVKPRRIQITQR